MSFTLRKETNIYDSQAIEKGMLDKIDTVLTDEDMFNRLTHHGQSDQVDAIKMINGKMYVNMTYLRTGTLKLGGERDTDGLMEVHDAGDNLIGKWSVDGISIKKGSIVLNEGNTTTEFRVDADGSLSVGHGTFTVTNAGVVTMKKGSITLNEGNATTEFKVNSNGSLSVGSGSFVVANTGALNVGSGAFQVTAGGSVTITKGSIQINTGTSMFEVNSSGQLSVGGGDFKVSNSGAVTISNRGSLSIGTKFSADSSGNVTAKNINLTGGVLSQTASTYSFKIEKGQLTGGYSSEHPCTIDFTNRILNYYGTGLPENDLVLGAPFLRFDINDFGIMDYNSDKWLNLEHDITFTVGGYTLRIWNGLVCAGGSGVPLWH